MKWYSDRKSNFKSTLIPHRLYALSEQVYDEVELREDGYYLIKRCGEKPMDIGHGHEVYLTDGKTLIYELPDQEKREIKLGWIPPESLGLYTNIGMGSNVQPILEGTALIDRRFTYERNTLYGTNIICENKNPERDCFIEKIIGNEDNSDSVLIDIYNQDEVINSISVQLEQPLHKGEYIYWNEVKSIYEIFTENGIIATNISKIIISEDDFDRIECNLEVGLSIPMRTLRPLGTPTGISLYSHPKEKGIVWNHVVGAERYEVYLNGVLLEETEYNAYISAEEFEGHVKIRAINEYQQSEFTDEVYIKSTPNEPYVSYIENYVQNNEHIFKVHFVDKSNIETTYRVRWSLDGREEVIDEIRGIGGKDSVYTHTIKIPDISNNVTIRVTSVNESGETIEVEPTTFYITSTPIWTYRKASSDILLEWTHNVTDSIRYKIVMTDNEGNTSEEYSMVESEVGTKIRHSIPLSEDKTANIYLVAVKEEGEQIPTKPIQVGLSLDKTLIPPTLSFTKITDDGEYEFVWDDIYTVEDEFEIIYSVSGGPLQRAIIPTTTQITTGRRYRFSFTFDDYGSISAKVKMNWRLGSSDYSNEVLIYYIPSNETPPSYIRRDRLKNGMGYNISWEGQQYVKEYEVLVSDGYLQEPKTLIAKDNHLVYDYILKDKPFMDDLTTEDKNKWRIDVYPGTKADSYYPIFDWIEGLEKISTRLWADHMLSTSMNLGDNYVAHIYTNVYVDEHCTLSTKFYADDTASLWLNGQMVHGSVNSNGANVSLNFVPGWNKIEILLNERIHSDGIRWGDRLSEHPLIKIMTHLDSVYDGRENTLEFKVRSKYLDDTYSLYSDSMIFTPEASSFKTQYTVTTSTSESKDIITINTDKNLQEKYDLSTKSTTQTLKDYILNSMMSTPYTIAEGPYVMQFSGKDLRTENQLTAKIVLANYRQNEHKLLELTKTDASIETEIGTYIKTMYTLPHYIYTEINKVRIVTIGDSITAGHPGHWAETMTGDERSQYQYWLNIRLKGQFEIINKGYGSDTTDDILARFDKDVLGYNASYCIIQGGTNDLYWAMAEASGDKSYLDAKVEQMKNNIIQMSRKCWDNGITPIIGTLIPRTGATGIYKDALYEYNQWIIDYCTGNDNIFYIDFFNAGKEKIPPTPLEDPINPGALNPIYDGDAIYDEFGNLIKQGRGIHPNWEGYRIMGECIPLNIFKTGETGLKLYLDADCTIEEEYNDDDKVNPFYRIDIDGVRRKVTKKIVRYVKNVGNNQNLFVAYSYDNYNIDVKFLDANGRRMDYANGLLPASAVARIEMVFDVYDKDSKASVNLYLASREFKVG